MNLPNKLSVIRICIVPFFFFFGLYAFPTENGETISRIIAAVIFLAAALTDLADGKIARSYGLITDFGKFLDPLADKFLVFSAVLVFISSSMYHKNEALHLAFTVCGMIVIFRELAVTSLRLVVMSSKKPLVIAASWYGKAKTVSQCIWVMIVIIEPIIPPLSDAYLFSWIATIVMTALTVLSGADYLFQYRSYIDPKQ